MRIDLSRAVGAYAAVVTVALVWLVAGGAAPSAARFDTVDVGRINVREPDGTLRMTISNRTAMPGLIVGKREYPHPNRHEAGMIFFNDEGIENGGLVFDGGLVKGQPANGGSLTFDRYKQDQTVQLTSIEQGQSRYAGLIVNDRPDRPMDFDAMARLRTMPPGEARTQAFADAGFGGTRRAYLGSTEDHASRLELGDGKGQVRLRLSVDSDGAAAIEFVDPSGHVVRRIAAK